MFRGFNYIKNNIIKHLKETQSKTTILNWTDYICNQILFLNSLTNFYYFLVILVIYLMVKISYIAQFKIELTIL